MAVTANTTYSGIVPEIQHYTPASLPLYISAFLVTMASIFGVDLILDDPSFTLMISALISIGFVVSFVSRRQNISPQNIQIPALIVCGCLVILAIFANPVQSFLAPANVADDRVKALAVLIIWLVVFRSFTLINDGSLLFSCVTTIALLGLVGTSTVDPQLIFAFMVFLASAVFMMIHETFLQTRQPNEADIARQSRFQELSHQGIMVAMCLGGTFVLASLVTPAFQLIGSFVRVNAGVVNAVQFTSKIATPVQTFDDRQELNLGTGPVHPLETVVMRVKSSESSYWRSATYDKYTGHTWQNTLDSTAALIPDQRVNMDGFEDGSLKGQAIYSMDIPTTQFTQTGARSHILTQHFILVSGGWKQLCGAPDIRKLRVTEQRASVDSVGSVKLFNPISQTSYEVESELVEMSPEEEKRTPGNYPIPIRNTFLQIPAIGTSDLQALKELAIQITAKETSAYGKVKAIEAWVGANCKYNLNAPSISSDQDVAATFLLRNKQGYCDVFASGVAILSRLAGVPARVATGFIPGELDAKTGEYVVRDKDRHLWAEAYFLGVGWQRFDSTGLAEDISNSDDGSKKKRFDLFTWIFSKGIMPPFALLSFISILGYVIKVELFDRIKQKNLTQNPLGLSEHNYEIVNCYTIVSNSFSKAGFARLDWETPSEFLARIKSQLSGHTLLITDFMDLSSSTELFRYSNQTATKSDAMRAGELALNIKKYLKSLPRYSSTKTANTGGVTP